MFCLRIARNLVTAGAVAALALVTFGSEKNQAVVEQDLRVTGDRVATAGGELVIHPIQHATFVMGWRDTVIYVDPVGGAKPFESLPKPDLILITDIHGDHMNAETVAAVRKPETQIVAPAAVADRLKNEQVKVLANGETTEVKGIKIEAVPMYNLTADRLKYHDKGRGNGYVLTFQDKRLYISGDTEDIPEMRMLKNIDVAFVCMNLPFTMTVDQAASAVLEFRPAVVYPYHHRGSDVKKFKELVGKDPNIEVRLREWYSAAAK